MVSQMLKVLMLMMLLGCTTRPVCPLQDDNERWSPTTAVPADIAANFAVYRDNEMSAQWCSNDVGEYVVFQIQNYRTHCPFYSANFYRKMPAGEFDLEGARDSLIFCME